MTRVRVDWNELTSTWREFRAEEPKQRVLVVKLTLNLCLEQIAYIYAQNVGDSIEARLESFSVLICE